jgi:microcin C transport system substrate-binding protein
VPDGVKDQALGLEPREERQVFKKALSLLEDSGWELHNGRLRHKVSHLPFRFDICINNLEHQKSVLYFKKALQKVGIDVTVRFVDSAQYQKRLMDYNYDMIVHFWGQTYCPGQEQKHYWGSEGRTQSGTRNYAGIADTQVDAACNHIAYAQNADDLASAVEQLDRLLLGGYYVIPWGYNKEIYGAYSKELDHPPINPRVGIVLSTWWHKKP